MDFLSMAKARYSVRKYKDTPVEAEKLQKILEAGRIAPTATNAQPQKVLVLQSKEALAKASEAARFYDAPVLLVVCADKDIAWKRKYDGMNSYQIDASIVTDHIDAAGNGTGSRHPLDLLVQGRSHSRSLRPAGKHRPCEPAGCGLRRLRSCFPGTPRRNEKTSGRNREILLRQKKSTSKRGGFLFYLKYSFSIS